MPKQQQQGQLAALCYEELLQGEVCASVWRCGGSCAHVLPTLASLQTSSPPDVPTFHPSSPAQTT